MDATSKVKKNASRGADAAQTQGQRIEKSEWFGLLVMVGLVAYGVVHLLIAWIALQIAWTGGGGGEASKQGALAQLAGSGIGDVILWVTALGLFALTVWQLFTALWGYSEEHDTRKKITRRLGAAGKAVVYLALGISALTTAAGTKKSGNDSEKTLTAKLLGVPFGKVLVIAVGIVVIVMGGRLAYRGIKKKFLDDLDGAIHPGAVRLGQIGYCAKGIAFGIVGVLFVVAALTYNPSKAGGLDSALRTLRDQPFGAVLLTLMALGIAAFGAYCFFWSRHAKR